MFFHVWEFGQIRGNISLSLLIFSFLSCGYVIGTWNYLLTFYLFTDSHNSSLNQPDRALGFFRWGNRKKMICCTNIKYNHIQKQLVLLLNCYWMGKIFPQYLLTFPPSLSMNTFSLTYECVNRLYLSGYTVNNYKFRQQKIKHSNQSQDNGIMYTMALLINSRSIYWVKNMFLVLNEALGIKS